MKLDGKLGFITQMNNFNLRNIAFEKRESGILLSKAISSIIHSVPLLLRFSSSLKTNLVGNHRPWTFLIPSMEVDFKSFPLLAYNSSFIGSRYFESTQARRLGYDNPVTLASRKRIQC